MEDVTGGRAPVGRVRPAVASESTVLVTASSAATATRSGGWGSFANSGSEIGVVVAPAVDTDELALAVVWVTTPAVAGADGV